LLQNKINIKKKVKNNEKIREFGMKPAKHFLCQYNIFYISQLLDNINFINKYKSDSKDFTRRTPLSFKNLIVMQLNLICSTVKNEFDLFFQILKNNMLDSSAPTRSAFTQTRRKIRHGAFIALNSILVKCFYDLKIYKTWNDLRLIGVDGSQFQMPASEACGIYFGKNRKDGDQQSYVMSRGISFYDVLNGFILKSEIDPYSASERELEIVPNKVFGSVGNLVWICFFYADSYYFIYGKTIKFGKYKCRIFLTCPYNVCDICRFCYNYSKKDASNYY
jgi:hypothetical protein